MTKLKITIKVHVKCNECRVKAMGLASSLGVDSVAMEGKEKDELVVVGEGVDSVTLAKKLRKKLGWADIIKVEEKKEEEKKKDEKKECCNMWAPCGPQMMICEPICDSDPPAACSIM